MMSRKTTPKQDFDKIRTATTTPSANTLVQKNEFGLSSTYCNCKVFMEGIGIKKYRIPSMKTLYKICRLSALEKNSDKYPNC